MLAVIFQLFLPSESLEKFHNSMQSQEKLPDSSYFVCWKVKSISGYVGKYARQKKVQSSRKEMTNSGSRIFGCQGIREKRTFGNMADAYK